MNKITLQLCERETVLDGHTFWEVRKPGEGGHQTAIIANHPTLTLALIAGCMFSRWSHENCYKYLIENFDFDKMWKYGTKELADTKQIVNPNTGSRR